MIRNRKIKDKYQTTPPESDYNRRFPIVFVVDTTISMTWKCNGDTMSLLDHLNKTIEEFIVDIVGDNQISPHAYVSYVAFADDVTIETDFKKPGALRMNDFRVVNNSGQRVTLNNKPYKQYGETYSVNIPQFHDIGKPTYSHIGRGVLRAIEKLEAYKQELTQRNIHYYVPLLVLITDGAPEDTSDAAEEEKAMQKVYDHCISFNGAQNLIIPMICGIGIDAGNTDLVKYSKKYQKGLYIVDPRDAREDFRRFFDLIRGSITHTIDLDSYQPKSPKPEEYRKPEGCTTEQYMHDFAGYDE